LLYLGCQKVSCVPITEFSHPSSRSSSSLVNPSTPNDTYSGRTAPLTSKRCILCIYSTNIGIEYFKHGIYSPFISLQNAVCFIILTYLVPVLFTFYIQSALKFKKNNSGAKRLISSHSYLGLRLKISEDSCFCLLVYDTRRAMQLAAVMVVKECHYTYIVRAAVYSL